MNGLPVVIMNMLLVYYTPPLSQQPGLFHLKLRIRLFSLVIPQKSTRYQEFENAALHIYAALKANVGDIYHLT